MEISTSYSERWIFWWSWEACYRLSLSWWTRFLFTNWIFGFESSVIKSNTEGRRKLKCRVKFLYCWKSSSHMGKTARTHTKYKEHCTDLDQVEIYILLKTYTAKLIEIRNDVFLWTIEMLNNHLGVNQVSVMAKEEKAKLLKLKTQDLSEFANSFLGFLKEQAHRFVFFRESFFGIIFNSWRSNIKFFLSFQFMNEKSIRTMQRVLKLSVTGFVFRGRSEA